MKPLSIVRSAGALGATGLLAATLGFGAAPAFGAAQTGSAAGMPFDLQSSPVGLPASCPFPNDDANFVFQSGTIVQHDSTNKNGDWGGATAQGTAIVDAALNGCEAAVASQMRPNFGKKIADQAKVSGKKRSIQFGRIPPW